MLQPNVVIYKQFGEIYDKFLRSNSVFFDHMNLLFYLKIIYEIVVENIIEILSTSSLLLN